MHQSRFNLYFEAGDDGSHVALNPLSGAMDLFDTRAIELLQHADGDQVRGNFSDFLGYCRERGYLYDDASEEEVRLKEAHGRWVKLERAAPFMVEVYPTLLCNLRCTYCFQGHAVHGERAMIEPEVVDAMFAAIPQLAARWESSQAPLLTLFGGEPLLPHRREREAIKSIIAQADARGYGVRIITNGVELGRYADLLGRYPVELVQVTLDGPQEVHDQRRIFASGKGTFDRIVSGIDRALEVGLPIVIRVNIDVTNVERLPDLARFILDKGWLDRGAGVGVAPVDEFVPESKWCAEQQKIVVLERLFEVLDAHPETSFMTVSSRMAEYFQHIVDHGRLPPPKFAYCPATVGNQISLDHRGNVFTCC